MRQDSASPLSRANGAAVALAFFLQGWSGMVVMINLPFCLLPLGTHAVALVFALPALASFAGNAAWGARFDRIGRVRPLLFAGLLSHALLHAGLLAPLPTAALFALLFLAPLGGSAITPALTAHVSLVCRGGTGGSLARLFLMESVGWGVGCVVGMIYGALPARGALHALAATGLSLSCLSLAAAALFREAPPDPGRAPAAGPGALEALRRATGDPELFRFALVTLAIIVANSIFFSMSSLYYENHLKGPRALYSMSMAGASILGAISYPLFGRLCDRLGGGALLRLALFLYFATYLAMALFPTPLVVACVYAIPLYPAVRVASNHVGAGRSGAAERGAAMGAVNGLHPLAALAAPLLGGAAVATVGLGALPALVCALFALLFAAERLTARGAALPAPPAAS